LNTKSSLTWESSAQAQVQVLHYTVHMQAAPCQCSFADFSKLLPSKAFQNQELETGKSQAWEIQL